MKQDVEGRDKGLNVKRGLTAVCAAHLAAGGFWLMFQLPVIGEGIRHVMQALTDREDSIEVVAVDILSFATGILLLLACMVSFACAAIFLRVWKQDYGGAYVIFPEDILRPLRRKYLFVYLSVAFHLSMVAVLMLRIIVHSILLAF